MGTSEKLLSLFSIKNLSKSYLLSIQNRKSYTASIRLLSRTCSNMDAVKSERDHYVNMPVEKKRTFYACGSKFVPLSSIPDWPQYASSHQLNASGSSDRGLGVNKTINSKVSLFTGDITALEIDAIVNAANTSLMGGGGVDGAIHRAAGPSLKSECATLGGCPTGIAKITGGYKLPAKHVIHTVGPIGENAKKLKECYHNSLSVAKANNVRSMAFPCISTGVYGYPNENAAHVALKTTRNWLEDEENAKVMDRVIFCLFLPVDIEIYERLMMEYFPLE